MKRILLLATGAALLLAAGCAELAQTARIMNVAFIELFRLPIYVLRLPFQILQNMGPIIQSAVRSAANVAPLLLFIENTAPPRRHAPYPAGPGELEEAVRFALASPHSRPLLDLLDRETGGAGAARRFVLLDARLAVDPGARAAVLASLGAGAAAISVARVDAGGIFDEPERFLALSRRMRSRGDMLVAATAFNDALAALAELPPDALRGDPGGRAFVLRLDRALRGIESFAHPEG